MGEGPGHVTYRRGASPGAPTAARTGRSLLRGWLWTGACAMLFGAGGLVFAVGVGAELGALASVVGLLAALLPLLLVIPAVLWLDRVEAEPPRYLIAAFLWGACVAAAVSLLLNTGTMLLIAQAAGEESALLVGLVVIAPVVEEVSKGLGVLLVLLLRRREFDGVVDGIVYAALVAAGFAFAENVLYFGRGLVEGGPSGLVAVLVVRGLFSPFAHPFFTACTGVGLGLAAARPRGLLRWIAPLIGLALAIGLHALWNASTMLGVEGALSAYLFGQFPLFLVVIGFALWARRREARVIARFLDGYARVGWFTPQEVEMLSSLPTRRRAREWAQRMGGSAAMADMRRLQDDGVELALLRQRIQHGAASPDAATQERALLQDIAAARARLYGPR